MKKVVEIKQQILEENEKEIIEFLEKHNLRFVEKEVETGNCINCGKEFIKRGVGTSNEKKFCSFECRTRLNSRIRHEVQQKYNEEYRKKRKEYFDKWRKENREHFNDLVREPNKIRCRELYKKWDEEGLCVMCGKPRDNPKSKTCKKCYERDYKRRGSKR